MKAPVSILLACALGVSAQNVISYKAGTINYTDGEVLLDSKKVKLKAGSFPRLAADQRVETRDGRAEILLGPGSVLRLGENSSVKMLNDRIEDTRLELVSGSAVVECVERLKDNAVTLVYRDAAIALLKDGLYRLDSEPAQLSVYDGQARVEQARQTVTVKKGRQVALNGVLIAEKFDARRGDSLHRWARQRSEYLALANLSAAAGASRRDRIASGWLWSGLYNMYTYMPLYGACNSYWGYRYWTPSAYYRYVHTPVYTPAPSSHAMTSGGYYGTAATSVGTSGTAAASAPATTSSSASSAPVSHSGGSAGGIRR